MESLKRGRIKMGLYTKERPRCRKAICDKSLSPCRDAKGYWDGYSALTPDGRRAFLSEGVEKQMRKMLWEGYWPLVCNPSEVDQPTSTPALP